MTREDERQVEPLLARRFEVVQRGVVRAARIGPWRVVAVRPDQSGYGPTVAHLALGLQVARHAGAPLYVVRSGPAVATCVRELRSPSIHVLGRWTPTGIACEALSQWSLRRTMLAEALLEVARRGAARTGVGEGIVLRVADRRARALGRSSARLAEAPGMHRIRDIVPFRARLARRVKARDAAYFGLDFRRLYAEAPIDVALPPSLERRALRVAAQLGVDPETPLVALHVRGGRFREADAVSPKAFLRDARIEDHFDAIDYLVSQGFTVVRIGDPSMPPLRRRGVVDSATAPDRDEAFELWAVLRSRLFVAGDSGPYLLTRLRDLPCVATNVTVPLGVYGLRRSELFLPKLLRRRENGEIVPLRDVYSSTGISAYRELLLAPTRSPYTFVDNDAEDILHAVQDSLRLVRGEAVADTPAQAELARLALELWESPEDIARRVRNPREVHDYLGHGRIAPRFAERYW